MREKLRLGCWARPQVKCAGWHSPYAPATRVAVDLTQLLAGEQLRFENFTNWEHPDSLNLRPI